MNDAIKDPDKLRSILFNMEDAIGRVAGTASILLAMGTSRLGVEASAVATLSEFLHEVAEDILVQWNEARNAAGMVREDVAS